VKENSRKLTYTSSDDHSRVSLFVS